MAASSKSVQIDRPAAEADEGSGNNMTTRTLPGGVSFRSKSSKKATANEARDDAEEEIDAFDPFFPNSRSDSRHSELSRSSERRLSFGRVGVLKTDDPVDVARSLSLARKTTDFSKQRAKLRRPPVDLFSRGMADPESKIALLASDARFQNWALVVIVLNAVWIGIDQDHNHAGSNIPLVVFDVGEHIFGFCFTFEILVRILAYKSKMDFFKDKVLRFWNIFDLCLVLMMVVEIWVLLLLHVDASTLGSLSVLRLLRLLRITRVFRMVPELGMMVKSMAAAARSVSSTLAIILALMYVFAIILTQWVKSSEERLTMEVDGMPGFFDDMFGTIPKSMLTLWQVLVFDDTFSLIRSTLSESPPCGILLLIFIMLGSFMILNILIGVICEIVSGTTESERDKILKERIVEVFDAMDVDGSGTLTESEFNAQAANRLQKLGVDEVGPAYVLSSAAFRHSRMWFRLVGVRYGELFLLVPALEGVGWSRRPDTDSAPGVVGWHETVPSYTSTHQ
ncbi:hypothetical protein FOL47_009373 [Perkinsus chesapeaki]|uniref:EF-hand domain-containing protein n=1 Tax=Perkinsus chesapeaki TaxID=330153 RepID=A0A7J6MTX3_PERCH|nr:hypothetical protein FOL47_009373 [Perkinsus chesapeaki]